MIGKLRKICISAIAIMILATVAVLCFNRNSVSANALSDYEVDYIPIESVEIISDLTSIQPGQSVDLDVKLTPVYAKDTVQKITYQIVGGAAFAKIDGNVLTAESDAKIGGVITVEAVADNVRSFNSLSFTVIKTPVESVKITNEQTRIEQGASLQLTTLVSPYNATNKGLIYSVVSGSAYAFVNSEGLIRVANNLPAGDLKITVKVTSVSDFEKYDAITFSLYVPTRTLHLSADNSQPHAGGTVTILPIIDSNATQIVPEYTVLSGEEYIESISGNTVLLKGSITDFNPVIVIKAVRDGLSAELKMNLYIPTSKLTLVAEKQAIQQGEMLQLGVEISPANATLSNLKYVLAQESKEYATVAPNGILTALLTDVSGVTVKVYAMIDDTVSNELLLAIEKPELVLTADNYCPVTCGFSADIVTLSTLLDGIIQNTGVEYIIKSGKEFINGSIVNHTLKIKTGITEFNPQIVLSAKVGNFESGAIILNIKILAQAIEIENADITQVEQQRSYSFKGSIFPANATLADEAMNYSLNVNSDVAEIDQSGLLVIKPSAEIGQKIIITITGADGTIKTHHVTVKPVYATKIEIVGVTKTDGTQLTAYNPALPNDVIRFTVAFPEPFNVTDSQKTYSLSFVSGDTDVASIENNTLIIHSQIEKSSPSFIVRVSSDQGGVTIYQDYEVTVYIAVTSVLLSSKTVMLDEGARVKIESVIDTAIYPLNSNVRTAEYRIISGGNYAFIDGDDLVIEENVESGDITFTIMAVSEGVESNVVVVGIYVKTKTLSVVASNYNPQSKINSGETVTLTSVTDERATLNSPVVTILSGAEYIAGGYKIGDVITNEFSIEKNLTAKGVYGAIKLMAEQDGITYLLDDIIVFVPVESLSLGIPATADRDSIIVLTPIYNGLANAYVSIPGWTLEDVSGAATRTGNRLYIGKMASAGSVIVVSYKSAEAGAVAQSCSVTVNALVKEFGVVYGTPSSYPSNFSIGYGSVIKSGKANVAITSALQVEEGGYTVIDVKYNGQPLSNFGIWYCSLKILSGSDYASWSYIGDGKIRFEVKSNADGTQKIQYEIIIVDGNEKYCSTTQTINIFKKHETPSIQTYITNKETTLSVDWGTNVSTVSNLKFNTAVSGKGCTLTSAGKFKVTSSTADYNPVIRFTAVQYYNGVSYKIDESVTLSIRKINISNEGGEGPSHLIAISGVSGFDKPKRTGYIFAGYFTSSNGWGTKYYSSSGDLLNSFSSNIPNTLYASWTPITYNFEMREYYSDGYHASHKFTLSYGQSYDFTAPNISGYHFAKWHDPAGNRLDSTEETLTVFDLCSEQGQTYRYDACYEENSCLAEGTLITLADGTQKPVELLTGDEMLLVWNLHSGSFDVAPILFIDSDPKDMYEVINLQFSDGTCVKVIYEHAFWDCDLNQYVFLRNDAAQYIGHWFNKQITDENGQLVWTQVQLLDVTVQQEYTTSWSPVTFGYLCYYVNGMLSMPGATEGFINIFEVDAESMQYSQEMFEADIAQYGLFTYEEFVEVIPIPEILFEAFGGQYLKVSLGKGLITWETLNELIVRYADFFDVE